MDQGFKATIRGCSMDLIAHDYTPRVLALQGLDLLYWICEYSIIINSSMAQSPLIVDLLTNVKGSTQSRRVSPVMFTKSVMGRH